MNQQNSASGGDVDKEETNEIDEIKKRLTSLEYGFRLSQDRKNIEQSLFLTLIDQLKDRTIIDLESFQKKAAKIQEKSSIDNSILPEEFEASARIVQLVERKEEIGERNLVKEILREIHHLEKIKYQKPK